MPRKSLIAMIVCAFSALAQTSRVTGRFACESLRIQRLSFGFLESFVAVTDGVSERLMEVPSRM